MRPPPWVSGALGIMLILACPASPQAVYGQALSIDDAIAMAVKDSPQMSNAKAEEQQASAKLKAARSVWTPKIWVAETFTESTDPVFAFGARLRQGRFAAADFSPDRLDYPAPTSDYMSSASATWTIFDTGRAAAQVQGARTALKATEQQTAATIQSIGFAAVRAYYRALLSDQQEAAMGAAVARAQSFAKQAHDRVDAGLALIADGMEADVELSQRKQEQAEAESNHLLAYADLAGVLGDPTKTYTLMAPTGTPPELTQTLVDLQHIALQTRPDLASARGQIEVARFGVKAGHRAYGPQVSTFANVQADNPHPLGGGNDNWTAGAKIEMQIFDGGARRADVDTANAQGEAAQAMYREAETKAILQVKQAFYARQNAARQYGTSGEMVKQVEETVNTASDRYGAGLVTVTDVLRQQEQLRDVELTRARSLYQWWIGDAQLRLSTGTMPPGAAVGGHQ